jgi:hypothetical protein
MNLYVAAFMIADWASLDMKFRVSRLALLDIIVVEQERVTSFRHSLKPRNSARYLIFRTTEVFSATL